MTQSWRARGELMQRYRRGVAALVVATAALLTFSGTGSASAISNCPDDYSDGWHVVHRWQSV